LKYFVRLPAKSPCFSAVLLNFADADRLSGQKRHRPTSREKILADMRKTFICIATNAWLKRAIQLPDSIA
jgi:hypothetical protein